jgi:hypothetical protein
MNSKQASTCRNIYIYIYMCVCVPPTHTHTHYSLMEASVTKRENYLTLEMLYRQRKTFSPLTTLISLPTNYTTQKFREQVFI